MQTIVNELTEAYTLSQRLQRADFIGASGALLGRNLVDTGARDEGIRFLDTAAAAFDKIGQADNAAYLRALIAQTRGDAS